MQVELELSNSDCFLLGDEWEVVRVGWPREGETYIGADGEEFVVSKGAAVGPRIIVRRKWRWPEWIKPGVWIAMDQGGQWCLYVDKPERGMSVWLSAPGKFVALDHRFVDWTPPPVKHWKQSLMQKPMEDK